MRPLIDVHCRYEFIRIRGTVFHLVFAKRVESLRLCVQSPGGKNLFDARVKLMIAEYFLSASDQLVS